MQFAFILFMHYNNKNVIQGNVEDLKEKILMSSRSGLMWKVFNDVYVVSIFEKS